MHLLFIILVFHYDYVEVLIKEHTSNFKSI